jgi:ethanolamine permease
VLAGGVVGIVAIFSDQLVSFGGQTLTANIVTMSVFGAITMYIVSMLSLFKLRRTAPDIMRPWRAPMYPWVPAFAIAAVLVCLVTMVYYNFLIFCVYLGLMAGGYAVFLLSRDRRPAPATVETI